MLPDVLVRDTIKVFEDDNWVLELGSVFDGLWVSSWILRRRVVHGLLQSLEESTFGLGGVTGYAV